MMRSAAAGAGLLLLAACADWVPAAPGNAPVVVPWAQPASDAGTLEQGWDAALAARFHYTPQGSRMIPRAYLLALERADSETRFAAPESLTRYGLIYAADGGTGLNPDRLPIGFAIEPPIAPDPADWVGITCAACHTNIVTHRGTRLRIDGAPAVFDYDSFVADMAAAIRSTRDNPAKFARFAQRIGTSADALRPALARYAAASARHLEVQRPGAVSGFARVDALTQIVNAISVLQLDAPPAQRLLNRRAPEAPASYPALWYTPRLDWVQWVPIAGSPIGRNAGEVLGVFGDSRLTAPGDAARFTATVRFRDLHALESWVEELQPPAWPEPLFGAIDQAKWREGRALFRANCAGCHNLPPFRLTDPTQSVDGRQFIRASAVPLSVVGTDPTYLRALADRRIITGPLADLFAGASEVAAPTYFSTAVRAVVETGTANAAMTRRMLLDSGEARACPAATRRQIAQVPQPTGRYEARGVCDLPPGQHARRAPERWTLPAAFGQGMKPPLLLGLWASGPYLHNGSVPTVYDVLSPPAERPRVFWVGGREVDTAQLGFVSTEAPGLFRFDTSQPGNANQGHAFPRTPLAPAQRMAVIEYLKNPLREGGGLVP